MHLMIHLIHMQRAHLLQLQRQHLQELHGVKREN
jgi:hypothetical protein